MATPRAASVLERGNIYFAYRPKVQAQTAHGFNDVQRFYVVLSPRGKASYRLIVIGQKKLPAVAGRGDRMAWGFVEEVSGRPEDVEDELDARRDFTKTHGERGQPAARPANEGVYAIDGIPLDPPDVLDHEGAEIVLIGAKRSVSALGLRLEPRRETEATAEIFTELRMEKSLHPVGPLLEGKWE